MTPKERAILVVAAIRPVYELAGAANLLPQIEDMLTSGFAAAEESGVRKTLGVPEAAS